MSNLAKLNQTGLKRVGNDEIVRTRAMLSELLNSRVRTKSGRVAVRSERILRSCLLQLERQIKKGNMDAIKYAMSMLAGSTDVIADEMNNVGKVDDGDRVLGKLTRKTTIETAEIRGKALNGQGHGTAV